MQELTRFSAQCWIKRKIYARKVSQEAPTTATGAYLVCGRVTWFCFHFSQGCLSGWVARATKYTSPRVGHASCPIFLDCSTDTTLSVQDHHLFRNLSHSLTTTFPSPPRPSLPTLSSTNSITSSLRFCVTPILDQKCQSSRVQHRPHT